MKVLIWILCFLIVVIVRVICQNTGIILGGIPTAFLFGGAFWLAFLLSKAWDKRKSTINQKALLKSLPIRHQIANHMGCNVNDASAVEELAITTVEIVDYLKKNNHGVYMCKNSLTCCDTILFSCFVLRAVCIGSSNNPYAARVFSESYVSKVIKATHAMFMPKDDFYEMFDNRMQFYDRIFASKTGIEQKIAALLEEFEYIIKSDIIANEYKPFAEDSPLPILGIDRDLTCKNEVQSFLGILFQFSDKALEKVKAML